MRIGYGYDVHRLETGRPLILGGVALDHPKGLLGHSDADMVCHVIIDALLGAAALGDIGAHFPPSDPQWKDAVSLDLLRRVVTLIADAGYRVGNVDVTVVAEAPKLGPHIPAMRQNVAAALGVPVDRVSIKATTSERMSFVGEERGIAAHAVALVEEASDFGPQA